MAAAIVPCSHVSRGVSPMKGSEVFKQLLRLGVIVRAMDEYNLPGMVRVSVGLPEENRAFINALKRILK